MYSGAVDYEPGDKYLGMEAEAAGAWTSIILVFLSALCTGLNIYQKLVKFGGAGALVPITGFANSVAAPQWNSARRPGFRYRCKDIYHRRACDPVWRGSKLDIGNGILGFAENVSRIDGSFCVLYY